MKIKSFLITVIVLSTILIPVSSTAGQKFTSEDFFEWRDKLKRGKANDYKIAKFCRSLEGSSVQFESKIIDIKKDGSILADMDISEVFSLPEITLSLEDEDEVEKLKTSQTIEYQGKISGCDYNSYIDVLSLTISSGELQLHY